MTTNTEIQTITLEETHSDSDPCIYKVWLGELQTQFIIREEDSLGLWGIYENRRFVVNIYGLDCAKRFIERQLGIQS